LHKTSVGFDMMGFSGNLIYKKWPSFPKYTLKITPADPTDPDIGPDYIDAPSLSDIVEIGVKAERSGKSLELPVTADKNVSEAAVRKKIDTVIGDGATYRQQVYDKLPNQENNAFMGGIGLSAGYHYCLPMIICNVRAGLDYMWGKFKSKDNYPASLARLGWGIKMGTGIDYKLTDKTTFGLEGGIRLSAFENQKIGQTNAAKSWFVLPYMQAACGFVLYPDYGISAFIGYFFPAKFSINVSGGNIPSGSICKIDGLFGGLRFVRYF
jgi:hypothetical protein